MNEHSCKGCRYEDNIYIACVGCGGKRFAPPEETEAEKAARRAGKAEGLKDAAKALQDAARRADEHCSRGVAAALRMQADSLLARAEEVERE